MTSAIPAMATPAMDLPDLSPLGWGVVALSVVAAVWVIVKAVKLTLHPGETEPGHVKRVIFEEEDRTPRPPVPPADGDGPGR